MTGPGSQDWHIGTENDDPKAQVAECDIPWDEPPPICLRALEHRDTGAKKRETPCLREEPATIQETLQINRGPPPPKPLRNEQPITTPLMTLRDTVLDLAGKIESMSGRLSRVEFKGGQQHKCPRTRIDHKKYPN